MTIHIEELRFATIIGILDFERVTPQDVIVNLEIDYEYKDEFINYADVVTFIKSDMIEAKYLLIEDALHGLSQKITKKFPHAIELRLKITKPSILADAKVSVSLQHICNS
jgi:dihydroneopterin aldolase